MGSLDRADVFQAVQSIFQSMLGLEVSEAHHQEAGPDHGVRVTASVGLAGDWDGTVLIECSGKTACTLAGALLMAQLDEVDDNVKDVLGELANMLAGNISRQLPGSSALSLPCVVEGQDYKLGILYGEELVRERMACGDSAFTVSVIRASAKGTG